MSVTSNMYKDIHVALVEGWMNPFFRQDLVVAPVESIEKLTKRPFINIENLEVHFIHRQDLDIDRGGFDILERKENKLIVNIPKEPS